jgi:hypothetical protein
MNALRCAPVLLIALSILPALGWISRLAREPEQLAEKIARLEREDAEIDRLLAIITRRIYTTNEEVIAEVLAGRLSLLEAAARVRAAGTELPSWARPKLECLFPGSSDDERQCRRVIALIEGTLRDEPSRCGMVIGCLQAELREHLLRYGGVRLPEIDSPQAQPALGVLQ